MLDDDGEGGELSRTGTSAGPKKKKPKQKTKAGFSGSESEAARSKAVRLQTKLQEDRLRRYHEKAKQDSRFADSYANMKQKLKE